MPAFGEDLTITWGADTSAFDKAQKDLDKDIDETQQQADATSAAWSSAWTALIQFTAEGIDELGKIETQMLRIGALGGSTAGELTAMTDWARDFALETGVAAVETTQLLEKLQSQQFDFIEARDITIAAERLKSLGGGTATLLETTVGLTGILKNAPTAFRDYADAADFMRRIIDLGDVSQAELNAEIVDLASAANTAGVTMNDLGGIIALLTEKGKGLTTAGAQIRNILIDMAGSRVEQEATKRGLELTGNAMERLVQVAQAAERMGGLERGRFLEAIFQKENVTVGASLVDNIDELSEKIAEVGDRAGASSKNLDAWRDSIEQTRERAAAARTELALMFGAAFQSDFTAILNGFVTFAKEMRDVESETRKFVDTLTMAANILRPLAGPLIDGAITGFEKLADVSERYAEANKDVDDSTKVVEETTDKAFKYYVDAAQFLIDQGMEPIQDSAKGIIWSYEKTIEVANELHDRMKELQKVAKESAEATKAQAEAEKKRTEELGKATERIEKNIIQQVLKAKIKQQEDLKKQNEELEESQEHYNDSIRDMRIEMRAARAEQEASAAADGERVRQLDILGKAVGNVGDATRSRRRVTEGGAGSATGAAGGTGRMIPELQALLRQASDQQRAQLQPLLRDIATLPAAEAIRAQGDLVRLLEETKRTQEEARNRTKDNTNIVNGIALAITDVASTPEEITQIIEGLTGVSKKIETDLKEFKSARDQLNSQLSILASL